MAFETNFRRDILRITAWTAVLPALALWPFLSALPAFTLLEGAGSPLFAAVQVVLFVTGFWGAAALALGFWFLLSDTERARRAGHRAERGLLVGCYATLWTALFMIAYFAGR